MTTAASERRRGRQPASPLPPTAKVRLAAEVLATYARARRALRRGDLRSVVGKLRGGAPAPGGPLDRAGYDAGLRLARATSRTIGPLPTDSRCLMRALVLIGLLARRDVAARLVIGVRPGEEFGAHAWVELDGHPLLPSDEGAYERLVEI